MNPVETLRSTIEELADNASRTSLVDDSDADENGDDGDDEDEDADEDGDDENGDDDADGDDENGDDDEDADGSSGASKWRLVEAEVDETLYGVVWTVAGAYAVGAGGRVVHRTDDGQWRVAVPSGPAAKRNTLTCAAASEDGERVWFAGSSGALGMYDVTSGRKYDYSAPMEMTSTWEAIALTGERGEETLYVANGSGEVLPVQLDEDDCPTFGDAVKPGSGSTVPAVTVGGETPYAVDTSGNVFACIDDEWTDVGIRNAQINFTDVHANDDGRVLVAGGGGIVYRYDAACENWTPIDVGSVGLNAIDRAGDEVAVVGDGGHAYRRRPDQGWTATEAETEAALYDVALGSTDVAVGEGGAIVERERTDGGATDAAAGGGTDADGTSGDETDDADGTSGDETDDADGTSGDGTDDADGGAG